MADPKAKKLEGQYNRLLADQEKLQQKLELANMLVPTSKALGDLVDYVGSIGEPFLLGQPGTAEQTDKKASGFKNPWVQTSTCSML